MNYMYKLLVDSYYDVNISNNLQMGANFFTND